MPVITLDDYLTLVADTGRLVRNGKRGAIPPCLARSYGAEEMPVQSQSAQNQSKPWPLPATRRADAGRSALAGIIKKYRFGTDSRRVTEAMPLGPVRPRQYPGGP